MATKEVIYLREFLSKTDHKNISYSGSPDYEPYQTIAKTDENLRGDINKKFRLHVEHGVHRANNEFGFDGKQQHKFQIFGNPITLEKNREKKCKL